MQLGLGWYGFVQEYTNMDMLPPKYSILMYFVFILFWWGIWWNMILPIIMDRDTPFSDKLILGLGNWTLQISRLVNATPNTGPGLRETGCQSPPPTQGKPHEMNMFVWFNNFQKVKLSLSWVCRPPKWICDEKWIIWHWILMVLICTDHLIA